MQPVNKTVRRVVFRDCLKAMFMPLVLLSASNLLARLLSVLTASVFGDFADAVFAMDRSIGLRSVLILAACILATVVLAPAVSMLGNFSMLRNALRHDNVIFGRFLRQDMQKALEGDLGELQYQLEDAPNDLRIYWINIMSQALALPIGWAYLLWWAAPVRLRASPPRPAAPARPRAVHDGRFRDGQTGTAVPAHPQTVQPYLAARSGRRAGARSYPSCGCRWAA